MAYYYHPTASLGRILSLRNGTTIKDLMRKSRFFKICKEKIKSLDRNIKNDKYLIFSTNETYPNFQYLLEFLGDFLHIIFDSFK
jgi:hypothetical protein